MDILLGNILVNNKNIMTLKKLYRSANADPKFIYVDQILDEIAGVAR